jgi:hypothetical protein
MPVIVPPEAFHLWLDCAKVDAQTATTLLVPAREDLVEAYEISSAVNRVANDSQALLAPATAADAEAASAAQPAGRKRKAANKDSDQASLF